MQRLTPSGRLEFSSSERNRMHREAVGWMMGAVRKALAAILGLCVFAGACAASYGSTAATPSDSPTPTTSPTPTPSPSPPPEPEFEGGISRIDHELREILIGRNWHPGCPVPIRDLRLVTVSYWGFDGVVKQGPLVVNKIVAEDVLWVFQRLFRAEFQIRHIALAHKWRPPRPSDWFSKVDNSAAFNCRPVTEGTSFSQHSYGWAIDINPTQNPYVRADGTVLRKVCKKYRDRSLDLPGMIHPGDVVTRSFHKIGWGWGGNYVTIKDYMHFSLTGG